MTKNYWGDDYKKKKEKDPAKTKRDPKKVNPYVIPRKNKDED